MSAAGGTPPGWYPDPHRRHQHRWFDGGQWTPHVSTGGVTSTESSDDWAYATGVATPQQVQQQVTRAIHGPYAGAPGSRAPQAEVAAGPPPAGTGSLFN